MQECITTAETAGTPTHRTQRRGRPRHSERGERKATPGFPAPRSCCSSARWRLRQRSQAVFRDSNHHRIHFPRQRTKGLADRKGGEAMYGGPHQQFGARAAGCTDHPCCEQLVERARQGLVGTGSATGPGDGLRASGSRAEWAEHHQEAFGLSQRKVHIRMTLRPEARLCRTSPTSSHRAHGLVKALAHFDKCICRNGTQQCRLVFEVAVRRAGRHAHRSSCLSQREALDAVPCDQGQCRLLERRWQVAMVIARTRRRRAWRSSVGRLSRCVCAHSHAAMLTSFTSNHKVNADHFSRRATCRGFLHCWSACWWPQQRVARGLSPCYPTS